MTSDPSKWRSCSGASVLPTPDARFSAARRAQVTCDGPDGLSGKWPFSLHIGIRSTTSFVTFLCRRSCAGITMASQVLHVLPRAVVLPRNAAVYELT
jgi:hypothetical protein